MCIKIKNLKKITKEEVQDVVDNCFITKYNNLFHQYLLELSPSTREIIRGNKELNKLFDLLLDYTIDASQNLDYKRAKEFSKNIDS